MQFMHPVHWLSVSSFYVNFCKPRYRFLLDPVEPVDLGVPVDIIDPVEPIENVDPVEFVDPVEQVEKVQKNLQD